jgi:hypothetical protein
MVDEQNHLAMANRHIVEGERRLTRQRILLGQLRDRRSDMIEADRLYENIRRTLDLYYIHRRAILDHLRRLNAS